MKRSKTSTVCVVAILASASILFGLGQSVSAEQQGNPQKLCPVMGGEIDKSVYLDYQGKRVYFCCAGCIESFNKEPQKFIQKMTAEGITLEDAPRETGASAHPPGQRHEGSSHAGMDHGGPMHHSGMH